MTHDGYPAWICADCGTKYGRAKDGHCPTFHFGNPDDPMDACGWCGTKHGITEPRDYGYPAHPPAQWAEDGNSAR